MTWFGKLRSECHGEKKKKTYWAEVFIIHQKQDGDLKNEPEKIFLLNHHRFEYALRACIWLLV